MTNKDYTCAVAVYVKKATNGRMSYPYLIVKIPESVPVRMRLHAKWLVQKQLGTMIVEMVVGGFCPPLISKGFTYIEFDMQLVRARQTNGKNIGYTNTHIKASRCNALPEILKREMHVTRTI